MSKRIKFHLNQAGVQEAIYVNDAKLRNLEQRVAEQALGETRAAFLQEFGVTPALELEFRWATVSTPYVSGRRPVYRIRAANAQTTFLLKKHPGWLNKFAQNARL